MKNNEVCEENALLHEYLNLSLISKTRETLFLPNFSEIYFIILLFYPSIFDFCSYIACKYYQQQPNHFHFLYQRKSLAASLSENENELSSNYAKHFLTLIRKLVNLS